MNLPTQLPTPSVEYGLVSPMLIVLGAAVLGVLVEALLPRRLRYRAQVTLSVAALVAAFGAVVFVARDLHGGNGVDAVMGAIAVDMPALFLQGTILLVGVLGILLIGERAPASPDAESRGLDAFTPQASAVAGSVAEKVASRAGVMQTEVFPLTMFALAGMLLFPAANDLLTMFIALEVLSLPLYLLCGLARRRRLLSQESSLKYFLLGAFASAFFLYGAAMLYGYAGTLRFQGIAEAVSAGTGKTSLALIGTGLVLVGVLFKVGAVPFHSWIPDVYQGAPTPITAFMAAATKIAAFGAMLRLFYVALPELRDDWRPVLWAIAIVTMVVGTVTAVTQNDVKRMLGYSAVAHTGFILTGVIAGNAAGVSSTLFYLFAYGFSTLGAFAVVGLVRDADGEEDTRAGALGGSGQAVPGGRHRVRAVSACVRGDSVDERFRQQVRGVQSRGRGRRDAPGGRRGDRQRHRRVLLRAGDRADVLHRTPRRRAGCGGAQRADDRGGHRHRSGHVRARRAAAATAGPGRLGGSLLLMQRFL